jgi:hypothetical protein
MIKRLALLAVFISLQAVCVNLSAQPEFKYGFGGGVNLSMVSEQSSYPLFVDISGNNYTSKYSGLGSNLGNQYFFHGELWFKNFIVAIKPGSYTYKFSKTDEIVFNTAPMEQTNNYLLRYVQIPIEVKKAFGQGSFKPFIGGAISYGHLLQGGDGTFTFIKPRFAASPVAGAYYSFDKFDLVLTGGYNFGLHTITKKTSRYNTGSDTPYSQSDIKLNDLHISLSVLFAIGQKESKGALDCPPPGQRFKNQKSRKQKRN